MRVLEGSVFISLALAAHLGILGMARNDGQQAAGAAGDTTVTLTGSLGSIETMVADWKRPPDAAYDTTMAEPPTPTLDQTQIAALQPSPDRVAPASVSRPNVANALPTHIPEAVPLPQPPAAAPELASSPSGQASPKVPEPSRSLAAKLPARVSAPQDHPGPLPNITPPPALNALREATRPMKRPVQRAQAPVAEQQSKPAPAQPAARAKGRGAGANAGSAGNAVTSTVSQGQKAKLMAVWSSQIQRRIQRKLVYPRKARERRIFGKVMVRLTVNSSGQILSSSISKGSGTAVLDRAAQSTIANVGTFSAAPDGLSGGSYSFNVPIVFKD